MIILVGESGSGKSSIEKLMVEKYGYKKIVSYTTRSPRKGELNGIDYRFINDMAFDYMKQQGMFVETAEYNGWKYGTAKADCTDDKVAVLTPHGLRQMKKIDGINITSFYIKVPRRDRLIKILQRGDNLEESYRRSLSDVGQFDGIVDEVDYIISNSGYEKSIEEMTQLILNNIKS